MSVNTVSIAGNLTRDPEVRVTSGGLSVMQFGVAVNERRKDSQTGEWEDYASFIDCTLFGKRAQALEPYLRKGDKVAVQGRLRQDRWQAQDGTNRSKVGVIVDELDFMSRRDRADSAVYSPSNGGYGQNTNQPPRERQTGGYAASQPPATPSLYDEDIPF